MKYYRDKNWLENQYINLEKTMRQIAGLCNCWPSTINTWLKKFNIETRKNSDKGKKHWNWKGGTYKHHTGYIMIRMPEHPRSRNGYIEKHIIIAEKMLGRKIDSKERVHHIDFDKTNNNEDNLFVYPNSSKHQSTHKKLELIGLELLKKEFNKHLIFNKNNGMYEMIKDGIN